MIDLCRKIADKNCELKYYSYLYDVANDNEKSKIKSEVVDILNKISVNSLKKFKLRDFKKNWVFFAIKKKINPEYINKFNKLTGKKVIALLIPMNGEFKFLGKAVLKGVLAGLNFFYGNNNYKIFIFDTSKDQNLKKFLNVHKDIKLIIGPILDKNGEMFKKIIASVKIPAIFLTPNLNYAKFSGYIFTHNNNIHDEIKKLCEVIKNDGMKNLAILYPTNDLGYKFKNLVISYCGMAIIKAISSYSPDKVDFKSQLYEIGDLERVKGERYIHHRKIDSIFIADGVDKALLIIPQLYFYDFRDIKIYGTDLWNSKKIYDLDKKYLKNITFVDCVDYNDNTFLKEYFKEFSLGNLNFYSILAYDTITIVKNLNFSTKESIINDLKSKKFDLLTGLTYFDSNGISHKTMKVFRINFK